MQRCLIYEKTMAADTKNSLRNNCKDHSRRKLLVAVDLFCLFLGEFSIQHVRNVTAGISGRVPALFKSFFFFLPCK